MKDLSELTTVNHEMVGQNYTDSQGMDWIWDETEQWHMKKYQFDDSDLMWYKLNTENWTYESTLMQKPMPTAAMGKYGNLRLKFMWQTPCLLDLLEWEKDKIVKSCEKMNDEVLELIDNIVEKKKRSEEYKEIVRSGKYIPMVQILERYKSEAEEELLPVTVYAI